MSYHPPFARMRQIKRDAPPPLSKPAPPPVNVEAALAVTAPETVIVVEEPASPPPVVKMVDAVLYDQKGRSLLQSTALPEPPALVVTPPPVPEPVVVEVPKFNPQMKKSELLLIAQNAGLDVTEMMTKNQILAALQGE